MAIREDLVASATQFLQDPSVASATVENRISFLRSKNLTQEEIDVALARTGGAAAPASGPPAYQVPPSGPPPGPPAQYYQQFPQHAWQPPPPPRRDWRDWFIMATVASGVTYGLYALGKRYVMPLVAPPTPEKLEQDKKSIEEQFDHAFNLVEQLSKDTEELKKAEQQRTERLDSTLAELESVMAELKTANRRREDDAQRVRDEVQQLKDSIPKAMNNQKDLTDNRLREINGELTSLKTLVSQRMNSNPSSSANPLRPVSGQSAAVNESRADAGDKAEAASEAVSTPTTEAPRTTYGRSASGLPNGNSTGKASIPAWQMAFANQNDSSSSSQQAKVEDEAPTSS